MEVLTFTLPLTQLSCNQPPTTFTPIHVSSIRLASSVSAPSAPPQLGYTRRSGQSNKKVSPEACVEREFVNNASQPKQAPISRVRVPCDTTYGPGHENFITMVLMGIHVPPCTVQTGRGYGSGQPQLLSSFCRRGLPLWTLPWDGGSSNIPWTVKAFITASSHKTPASGRRVKQWRQTWPSDVLIGVLLVRSCLTILMKAPIKASCPHLQSPDWRLAVNVNGMQLQMSRGK